MNYIITRDESNDAANAAHNRNERLCDDVTKRNEATEAIRNEEFDWPNPAVSPKTQGKSLPDMANGPTTMKIFQKEIHRMKAMHKILRKGGMILSCPKYLKTMLEMRV